MTKPTDTPTLPPTPAEVAASAETIVELRAKLEQAHRQLDVVAKARELRNQLRPHMELTGMAIAQPLFDAYFNIVGALAVLDDPGKKEQADGEES
jgi:hypothetical protein